MAARFWRLIPTLIFCASLTAGIEALLPAFHPDRLQSWKDYFLNIACLPTGNLLCDAGFNLRHAKPIEYLWVDGVYWSLLVEIRFYLVLWLLFYFLKLKNISLCIALLGLVSVFNQPVPFISKGQDCLLYLNFFAFGLSYRNFADKQKGSLYLLIFSAAVFIAQCWVGTAGLSMNINRQQSLNFAACFLIFTACIYFFKNSRNTFFSYLGIIS